MLKQKKKILYFQTVQIGMSVVSNIILGGITGAIINAQVWLEIYYVIKTN